MPRYEKSFKYRILKFPEYHSYDPIDYNRKFLTLKNSDKDAVKKKKPNKSCISYRISRILENLWSGPLFLLCEEDEKGTNVALCIEFYGVYIVADRFYGDHEKMKKTITRVLKKNGWNYEGESQKGEYVFNKVIK